eukprot:233330_1
MSILSRQISTSERALDLSHSGDILIEDWIEKKSKYLGSWRLRFAVLKRHNFTFLLCTFRHDCNINYSSYKKKKNHSLEPTEVIIIDYLTLITTHDSSFKQYTTDRFNVYLNGTTERYQFKINPQRSKRSANDWIKSISKAKLISQQLIHRMIPYYVLANWSRKYLKTETFPYEITQIIIDFMNVTYNANDINTNIWKWNRYHRLFDVKNTINSAARYYYFLRHHAISKGNSELLVDHTIFSIGSGRRVCSMLLTDPLNLKLHFDKEAHRGSPTKIIYHSLPNILPNTNLDLLLPSVTYHNDCLFVIGGCKPMMGCVDEYSISSSIYVMDFGNLYWKWREIERDKIPNAKYGSSGLFIEHNKLMVIGGWNKITKSLHDATKDVSLVRFHECDYNGFDVIQLHKTQKSHSFGGVCQHIGYNTNRICIGSQRHLEMYDSHKDIWCLYPWKTKVTHYRPQIWLGEKDKNILYIAGNGAHRIEWIDIREQHQWRSFQYRHCHNNANAKKQQQRNFNHYTPSVIVMSNSN